MVVGNMIFQTVDVMQEHAITELPYFFQQECTCGIVQNIIQGIIGHGAERKQGGFVEVAYHILVISPSGHFFDTLYGFVGISAVFGKQVGANQNIGVCFFSVYDATALAGEHGIFLYFVGQSLCQVRVDIIYRFHRGGEYFVGTCYVGFTFGFAFATFHEVIPLVFVEPYTGVMGGQFFKYNVQGRRAELPGVVLYRKSQRIAPFSLSVCYITVLPVPCTRCQVLFRVKERPACFHLYGRFRFECRALRVAQEVT